MTVDEPRGASVLKPAKTARTVAQTTPATVGQELRALIRAILLHAVRWESPHIARGQHRWRTPVLDLVFAKGMTLLGTHTFFLAGLPLLFWFGDVAFARHMTLQLAVGVMCTNAVKVGGKTLVAFATPLSPLALSLSHSRPRAGPVLLAATHGASGGKAAPRAGILPRVRGNS